MAGKATNQQKRFAQAARESQLPHQYTWAFHDSNEIGPVMLAQIAKRTGLKLEDI
jgi:hypothetical protein